MTFVFGFYVAVRFGEVWILHQKKKKEEERGPAKFSGALGANVLF